MARRGKKHLEDGGVLVARNTGAGTGENGGGGHSHAPIIRERIHTVRCVFYGASHVLIPVLGDSVGQIFLLGHETEVFY